MTQEYLSTSIHIPAQGGEFKSRSRPSDSKLLRHVLQVFGGSGSLDVDLDHLVQNPVKRGRSGAAFSQTADGQVAKLGQPYSVLGSRVVSQARWIEQHHNPALPEVHAVRQNGSGWGYVMERLVPAPLDLFDGQRVALAVTLLLKAHFWCRPAEVHFNESAHADRLRPIVGPLSGRELDVFQHLYRRIEWDNLSRQLTHGDPIFDNILFRRDGALVLSDPIPATSALPDVVAVDVGRVFQSCVGYERVAYNLAGPDDVPLELVILATDLSENDLVAALYFAMVHLLRAMVYVTPKTAQMLLERCVSRLAGEVACLL